MKGYAPDLNYTGLAFSFKTGPVEATAGFNSIPFPSAPTINVTSPDDFWKGYSVYLNYTKTVLAAGGYCNGDIRNLGNNSFSFSGSFVLLNSSSTEASDLFRPLFASLRTVGVNQDDITPSTVPYTQVQTGPGDAPIDFLFSSRLFPERSWNDEESFTRMITAIRRVVEEGGYLFRGRSFNPSYQAAGYPGSTSAISPIFRSSLMHATIFVTSQFNVNSTSEEWLTKYEGLNNYVNLIREATPGGGAYINEADVQEPNWQESFFGSHYPRLLRIKKSRDPWGLFWAPSTPGSEDWEVKTTTGMPTQNGPLCRTDSS
jgi:hypothetical protein